MNYPIFAVEKKQIVFLRGKGKFASSLKKENKKETKPKKYCLTNLNLLSEQRGTPQYIYKWEDKKTYIVTPEGKIVAEVEISADAIIIDNIIYDKQGKRLIIFDLEDI